jgi:hypothetical protein
MLLEVIYTSSMMPKLNHNGKYSLVKVIKVSINSMHTSYDFSLSY